MTEPADATRLTTPLEGTGHRPWDPNAAIDAPLCLLKTRVAPQWVDYNGHMSESCYLLVFGDNSDAFFRFIGVDEAYRAAGQSLYTVQTHLHNLHEVTQGEPIRLTLQVLDADEKRVHLFHAMFHGISGELLATGEQMLVHVDMNEGRAVAMPHDLQQRVQAIRAAHSGLPTPAQAGRPIGIRRKPG
jgi:acyl-CoA thioester hydrolase